MMGAVPLVLEHDPMREPNQRTQTFPIRIEPNPSMFGRQSDRLQASHQGACAFEHLLDVGHRRRQLGEVGAVVQSVLDEGDRLLHRAQRLVQIVSGDRDNGGDQPLPFARRPFRLKLLLLRDVLHRGQREACSRRRDETRGVDQDRTQRPVLAPQASLTGRLVRAPLEEIVVQRGRKSAILLGEDKGELTPEEFLFSLAIDTTIGAIDQHEAASAIAHADADRRQTDEFVQRLLAVEQVRKYGRHDEGRALLTRSGALLDAKSASVRKDRERYNAVFAPGEWRPEQRPSTVSPAAGRSGRNRRERSGSRDRPPQRSSGRCRSGAPVRQAGRSTICARSRSPTG